MSKLSFFGKFCFYFLLLMCFVKVLTKLEVAYADPSRPMGGCVECSSLVYIGDWLKEIRYEMKEQTKQQKRIADALEKKCN